MSTMNELRRENYKMELLMKCSKSLTFLFDEELPRMVDCDEYIEEWESTAKENIHLICKKLEKIKDDLSEDEIIFALSLREYDSNLSFEENVINEFNELLKAYKNN